MWEQGEKETQEFLKVLKSIRPRFRNNKNVNHFSKKKKKNKKFENCLKMRGISIFWGKRFDFIAWQINYLKWSLDVESWVGHDIGESAAFSSDEIVKITKQNVG